MKDKVRNVMSKPSTSPLLKSPENKATEKKINKRDQAMINKIVAQFSSRSRIDIDKWREAIKQTENSRMPRRTKHHDMARDLTLDLHLHSQTQVRELRMMCRKFRVVDKNTGKEIPEKTKLLEAPWLYQLMALDAKSVITGTLIVEIDQVIDDKVTEIFEIPGQHLSPETHEFLVKSTDRSGIDYREDEYVIEFKEKDFLGLINKLAPMVIWKKNALQAWAEFCEKFGIPMRYATTNKRDQASLDRIEKMLKSLGSAASAVFPEGTTIDFNEAESKDAYNVFDKAVERYNSEMSKGVNGVTMLSDNGSSKSQSEVHERVNNDIIKSDGLRFKSRMNFDILPKLFNLGLSIDPEKEEFEWDDTESLSKEKQWEIVKGVLKYYDVPDNWITEQFGIPIEGKKEIKNTQVPVKNFNKARPSLAMVGLIGLPDYKLCQHGAAVNNKSGSKKFEQKLDALIANAFDGSIDDIPKDVHLEKGKELMNNVKDGFKDRLTGIEYNSPDNLRMAMYEANVSRFSAASSYKDAVNLNKLARGSKTAYEFQKKAEAYKGEVLNYAQTEFNQAFSESQNAANWLRQQEDKDDYDLQYQTVGDNRVREEHQLLNGLVAPVDDPIWDTIYPPNGWQCRCEVIQIATGTLKATDTSTVDTSSVSRLFKKNPGKITAIFDSNHDYFQEFPEEKTLGRKKYGLSSWQDLDRGSKKSIAANLEDAAAYKHWWAKEVDRLNADNTDIYYRNYLGTYLKLSKTKLINKFEAAQYAGQNRYNIATHVEEIIQKPDEVWINNTLKRFRTGGKYTAVYLKNYKDGTYAVITKGDKELEVVTWYRLDAYEESGKKITTAQNLGNHRNGILLKSTEK